METWMLSWLATESEPSAFDFINGKSNKSCRNQFISRMLSGQLGMNRLPDNIVCLHDGRFVREFKLILDEVEL
tara:strand:- start:938 stop:1156 length:219 start_codon:yes stop_codon:yes gene_type:complete